jgi:hypothetical protein
MGAHDAWQGEQVLIGVWQSRLSELMQAAMHMQSFFEAPCFAISDFSE